MLNVEVERNLIAFEDLCFGTGTIEQSRGGTTVTLNKINAANLPYDDTDTLADKVDWLDSQYNYIVANMSSSFDHSTLIRRHATLDYLIDVNGALFVPRIEVTASSAEATYADKLWIKTISATEAHLKRGSDLVAKFNPTSHAQILDIDYPTIISTVAASFGSAATKNAGTSAGEVLLLAEDDKLPSLDASNLFNIPQVSSGVPIGCILMWSTTTPPVNFLICDGSAISRTEYETLYEVIGTTYGIGDGVNTFQLPEIRGEFIRGLDMSRGIDTGRAIGTFQNSEVGPHSHSAGSLNAESAGSHTHNINGTGSGGGYGAIDTGNYINSGSRSGLITSSGAHTHTIAGSTANNSGEETRPRNIAFPFIIRYQ